MIDTYKGRRVKCCEMHYQTYDEYVWLPARSIGVCPVCIREGFFAQEVADELDTIRNSETLNSLNKTFEKRFKLDQQLEKEEKKRMDRRKLFKKKRKR